MASPNAYDFADLAISPRRGKIPSMTSKQARILYHKKYNAKSAEKRKLSKAAQWRQRPDRKSDLPHYVAIENVRLPEQHGNNSEDDSGNERDMRSYNYISSGDEESMKTSEYAKRTADQGEDGPVQLASTNEPEVPSGPGLDKVPNPCSRAPRTLLILMTWSKSSIYLMLRICTIPDTLVGLNRKIGLLRLSRLLSNVNLVRNVLRETRLQTSIHPIQILLESSIYMKTKTQMSSNLNRKA